jgi:hypothetical protein
MTRSVPFTKASLRRVADVAREKDFAVLIRPDGTLVLEKRNYLQAEQQPVEQAGDVVL